MTCDNNIQLLLAQAKAEGVQSIVIQQPCLDCTILVNLAVDLPKPSYIYTQSLNLSDIPNIADCIGVNVRIPQSVTDWIAHLKEGLEGGVHLVHNLAGFNATIDEKRFIVALLQTNASKCIFTCSFQQTSEWDALLCQQGCIIYNQNTDRITVRGPKSILFRH